MNHYWSAVKPLLVTTTNHYWSAREALQVCPRTNSGLYHLSIIGELASLSRCVAKKCGDETEVPPPHITHTCIYTENTRSNTLLLS